MKKKKISVYVVNKKVKPANYYRIVQYAKYIPEMKIRNITPTSLFNLAVRFRDSEKWRRIIRRSVSPSKYEAIRTLLKARY